MRGEHFECLVKELAQVGIIPACAGSTRAMQSPSVLKTGSSPHARGAPRSGLSAAEERWDHPRMRGEHREGEYFDAAGTGIIPACAGSTPSVLEIKTASAGSSPHARGAPR